MPLGILHRAAPCRNVPVTFTLALMVNGLANATPVMLLGMLVFPLLVVGLSLAIVGKGLRLVWLPIALVLCALMVVAVSWLAQRKVVGPFISTVFPLLMFAVPLVGAGWFKRWRTKVGKSARAHEG